MSIYQQINLDTLWLSILDDDLLTGPKKAMRLIAENKLTEEDEEELVIELFDDALITTSFLTCLMEQTKFKKIFVYGGQQEHNPKQCQLAQISYFNRQTNKFAQIPIWKRLFVRTPKLKTVVWVEKPKNERTNRNTVRPTKE